MTTPDVTNDDLGEPTWRIALFYPQQGGWTEADYFELQGGPLVEYDDGCVEVLEIKPIEYAKPGIREFWLVDPESRTVTIHHARDGRYESILYDEHATAKSTVIPGFELPVAPILAAASAGPGPDSA